MKDSLKLNDQELDKLEEGLKEFFEPLGFKIELDRTPFKFYHIYRGQDGEKNWETYEYHVDVINGDKKFGRSISISSDKEFDEELKDKIWLFITDYWFYHDHDYESPLAKKLFRKE